MTSELPLSESPPLGDCAIGIDLGTTYSCVGVWQDGRVEIIANESGHRTTPSCIAFSVDGKVVGDAARNRVHDNPTNTIFDAKRLIGRKFTDLMVQADMRFWPFRVVAGATGRPEVAVSYMGEEKQFTPEELSAMVLVKMRETAEAFMKQPVTKAVITVPAYFNDSQRAATQDAGHIAGLEVLRIVNEPTAAAMAYGLHAKRTDKELKLLVFDLGGGTFDVSVLTIEQGVFEVKATGGDTHLGGEDFDNTLVLHFTEDFKKKYRKDMMLDPRAMRRLRTACERAKRTLSSATSAAIEIDGLFEGIDYSASISRARFEALNTEHFCQVLDTVTSVLSDSGVDKHAIDEVVLVGGSTRIPKIQEMLREFFDKEPNKNINPDEAVAYGAAIQAAILTETDTAARPDHILLVDVSPLSLGIEIDESAMSVVIPRNTNIPSIKTMPYHTLYDWQTLIKIKVFEGERPLTRDNNLLDTFDISGLPRLPRGQAKITVTFAIEVNGLLVVSATNVATGTSCGVAIKNERGRLSTDDISRMRSEADRFYLKDKGERERVQVKSDLVNYLYKLRDAVNMRGALAWILQKDVDTINGQFYDTLRWVEDNPEGTTEAFQAQLKRVQLAAEPIVALVREGDACTRDLTHLSGDEPAHVTTPSYSRTAPLVGRAPLNPGTAVDMAAID